MSEISAADPHPRKTAAVLDSKMTYVDIGSGDPVVFLHGNPTSSYLWRNVIPHVERAGRRCLAPDLIGMGRSGRSATGTYDFAEHARYLDAWFDAAGLERNVVLVAHDWGGALGMRWARRNPEKVQGIAYMETLVTPVGWDDWPEDAKGIFQAFRSPKGDELILERNMFVEGVLPNAIMRDLGDEELAVYRAPFAEAGEARRPTLTWPRQIPVDGEPADVHEEVVANEEFMAGSTDLPKLFVNAEPGSIMTGRVREVARGWPNQREVTVKGLHFIQEDSPHEIGAAVADFIATLG